MKDPDDHSGHAHHGHDHSSHGPASPKPGRKPIGIAVKGVPAATAGPMHDAGVKDGFIDPVCGMTVSPDSPRRHEYRGKTYYFCSDHCLRKFSADPAKYLQPSPPPSPRGEGDLPADAMYTCPMHPEVRTQGPGVCPKCGMALEPEMPTAEEDENPE